MLVADEAGDLLGVDAVQEGQRVRVVGGSTKLVEDLLGLGRSQTLPQELAGHVDTALAHLDGGSGVQVELARTRRTSSGPRVGSVAIVDMRSTTSCSLMARRILVARVGVELGQDDGRLLLSRSGWSSRVAQRAVSRPASHAAWWPRHRADCR